MAKVYKFKVNSVSSRWLQEELFKAGVRWWEGKGGSEIQLIDKPYLYLSEDGYLSCSDIKSGEEYFNNQEGKEVDLSKVFPPLGAPASEVLNYG